MSNQIVISSGAKVRSLEGVLTGTAGIVNSVPLGGANGVATLDALGKVPLSQLPSSVVTYLGTWNAATNTPTLTNGVGDVGDLYICNVAGTVNFGAGPITFAAGDWVIYSGTEWQKSSGASGTVTSVAVTESGDALTITGSPITTAGTINIGFAGTGSQYIKGDGTLATFPTTIDQAKRLITEVYNSTGATLTKGTVVYINGGQGNLPTVTKAQANADNTSAQTYGVVQSDITNNNNGFVVVIGSLTDIDTQAYAVGTQLYLSGTTAGDWTSTKPSAPIHLVYVGIVVRSHPTQGVVEIRIQNGYELEELHDVAISAPVNNQGIFYNSSNNLWENKSIATALGYTPANDALVVHLAGTETITGSKTFSATTLLNSIYVDGVSYLKNQTTTSYITGYTTFSAKANGIIEYYFPTSFKSILDFNDSADYTYTFPALTGTLALLEGTQTFSGAKTFSSVLTADSSLLLKNGVFAIASGYTNLAGNNLNNGLVVQFYGSGGTAITNNLNFNATTGYNYIFPAANGTIALTSNLSSYVPYTGATADVNLGTTYSLSANNITAAGVVKSDFGLQLKSGLTTTISGYLSISAQKVSTNSQLNVYTDTGFYFSLIAPNTANYSYTFPATSGTIALTNSLSTQTFSNNNIFSGTLNFTSTVTADNGILLKNGAIFTASGYLGLGGLSNGLRIGFNGGFTSDFILNTGASYVYTFPASTGTIALTSNLSSYLPLTGGTLTGALSGTSATFNTSIIIGNVSSLTGAWGNLTSVLQLGNSTTDKGYISVNEISGDDDINIVRYTYFDNTNWKRIGGGNPSRYSQRNAEHIFQYASSGADNSTITWNTALSLANNGAATFSSSVTATTLTLSTTTAGYAASITNVEDASQGLLIRATDNDTTQYLLNLQSSNTATGQTWVDRFAVTKAGNVGIGTSSPVAKLHINPATTNEIAIAINGTQVFAGANNYQRISVGDNYSINRASIGFGYNASTEWDIKYSSYSNHSFWTGNDWGSSTEKMRITSGGNLLVGTTTDYGNKLEIRGSIGLGSFASGAQFANFNGDLILFGGDTGGYNTAGAPVKVSKIASTGRSINTAGTINANGADYAEYMTKAIEDKIEKGDIVGVNQNGLLTNIFSDAKSFVVKSTNPSYVGGDDWASFDEFGQFPEKGTQEEKDIFTSKLELARQKVDRIAFSGQVPCNVYDAKVGDYIIPIELEGGKITGQAVTNPTFEQYQIAVGKVWKIMDDGRAWIAVKIG